MGYESIHWVRWFIFLWLFSLDEESIKNLLNLGVQLKTLFGFKFYWTVIMGLPHMTVNSSKKGCKTTTLIVSFPFLLRLLFILELYNRIFLINFSFFCPSVWLPLRLRKLGKYDQRKTIQSTKYVSLSTSQVSGQIHD